MTVARQTLGRQGEAIAASWYEQRGWVVLDRNWRCARGELDLVVGKGSTVAFVEVKARTTDRWGDPCEAVSFDKQRRLRRLGVAWLAESSRAVQDFRFDVASVVGAVDEPCRIEVFEEAF